MHRPTARQIGDHLRLIRKRRGLPQNEFAEEIGMGRPRYGAIERGEKNLTLHSIEALAQALGMTPLELVCPDHFEAYLKRADP